MIERIQYIHNHLLGIGKSIIYCSFTENNLKSCFDMFSVLPTGLDLSNESLPGWSYMFELRDQNSNVSLVYSMIQCVKRSSAYVHRHDLTLCWTQE